MVTIKKSFAGMPTNAELLGRCLDGDEQAWRLLVERYERLPFAMARREGLDDDQAADVTQHTFTELHRQMGTIRDPQALSSWLMTVCRREIWRQQDLMRDLIVLSPIVTDEADFAETHATMLAVYDAVQALGNPCRSLILGLFFDPAEPSYAEVAGRIGRPIGSVGPLRARCLERLKALMEGEQRGF